MQNFLQYSVSYGLLTANEKVIQEAIEAGVDLQKVYMSPEKIKKDYSTQRDEFSALWYAWVNHKSIFPVIEKGLTRHIDEQVTDFLAELIKTEEGLEVLKGQVQKGLDLTKVVDSSGNNLLHYFFRPLDCVRWTDSTITMPIKSLEFLLEQNVDPNSLNHQGKAPLHQVISFRGDKDSGKKVGLMIKHKADLCLEDAEGVSCMTRLMEIGLQSTEVIKFLKKLNLTSGKRELKAILGRPGNSDKLVQAYIEKGALDEYKMMEYIYPSYKNCSYENLRYLVEFDEQLEEMLKTDRLKDFLAQLTGCASSRITNLFLDYHKKQESISYRWVHSALTLKHLFMETGKENPDYLFETLSNPKIVHAIDYVVRHVSIDQTVGFFKIFSHKQILSLLTSVNDIVEDKDLDNTYRWSYFSKGYYFYDSVRMFWQYPEEMKALIETQKFSSINTLVKIHDFISREATKIKQKPYDLEQHKNYPEIKTCENKSLEELDSYKLIVPKSNHDLIIWGTTLGNCVGGGVYAERAKNGQSIILGVESENQLKYCLEIVNGKISQIEGKQRMRPPTPLMKSLEKTLMKAKLITKEKV